MGFFSGSKELVGLDIGTSAIKIVELAKSKNGFTMTSFGQEPIPEDAIIDGEIVNHIAVVDCIKRLTKQLKLKNKNVCISIAGTNLIIKKIQVPQLKIHELDDHISWEIEQYIPFNINDINFDYQVVRENEGGLEIILVAAKKDFLEMYANAVKDAGLNAKIIDVDSFALQNLFEYGYETSPDETVAIVDVGCSFLKINVVNKGIPVFTRDINVGGKVLTKEIQKRLGMGFDDAESMKVDGSVTGQIPEEIADLVQMISENITAEIKKSLDFYIASSAENIISQILLTGGSSQIPGLAGIIEAHIDVPVTILNPFTVIGYDADLFNEDYIRTISPFVAVPVGLALRGVGK